ncbi:signal peptidase I [Candidatus Enterococcus mansonii]|uniref:Signal peptidase I n=1 Tax=Candidatus Enterococcus mansonii TaxID=1834181 RepID=A0A242CHF8_9ENTE|nr:signal peptidase I [Enterococcus sp. 4G2_DIV0659]OTO09656.1 signal peptidase I [Enterococcus sp. 4G2_DIV0659]
MEQRKKKKHRKSSQDRQPRKKNQRKLQQESNENRKKRNRPGQDRLSKKRKRSAVHKKKRSLKKEWLKNLLDLLFYVVTLGLISMSVLFAFSGDQNKTIFGYRIFSVRTNSMAPNKRDQQSGGFYAGDVIIVKDIPGNQAKTGDVITYHPSMESKAFLTHRVVKKLDQLNGHKGIYYVTKGDNNNTEDLPISEKQVVGKKLIVFPKIGGILKFIRENFVVSIIFILSVFGFILVIKMYIFSK